MGEPRRPLPPLLIPLLSRLQEAFPEALHGTSAEGFYRAVNAVRPSPIQTEADELTYNLHVLLRFELEVALFEAWNAKTQEYLGFTPRTDASGVLQDTHWALDLFGYFPTYATGNVLSVQLFEAAVEDRPEIPGEMERGEFGALLGWLRENIIRCNRSEKDGNAGPAIRGQGPGRQVGQVRTGGSDRLPQGTESVRADGHGTFRVPVVDAGEGDVIPFERLD